MRHHGGMSRREALVLLAGVAPALVGATPAQLLRSIRDDDALSAWLRKHVSAADLTALAREYGERFPDEQTRETLEKLILVGRKAEEDVAATIARAVREDFETGRVVALDGWQLSRTEGRLVALAGAG